MWNNLGREQQINRIERIHRTYPSLFENLMYNKSETTNQLQKDGLFSNQWWETGPLLYAAFI
jgi:hypothetical protein